MDFAVQLDPSVCTYVSDLIKSGQVVTSIGPGGGCHPPTPQRQSRQKRLEILQMRESRKALTKYNKDKSQ